MADQKEILRPDDLVRLVNMSETLVQATYDGAVYSLNAKEETTVRRDLAEHLIRKTGITTTGGRVHNLKLVELPIGQRQKSPGEIPKLAQEITTLEKENKLLKEKIQELVGQIKELEAELKKEKKK